MENRILHLSLKKQPFEVMATGEKGTEYRKPSKWLLSRILEKNGTKKHYDLIKFVNGYGADKPYFICKYLGFVLNADHEIVNYSNGLRVEVIKGDTIILCGEITERGNL